MRRRKPYSINVLVNKKDKNFETKKAMATMYASSPYIPKRKKDKYIKDLFK